LPRSPEALRGRGVSTTLFYGARTDAELFYLDFFRALDVNLVLTTEDGSAGERGRIVAPLDRALASRAPSAAVMIYACGPKACWPLPPEPRCSTTAHARCRWSASWAAASAAATAVSCDARRRTAGAHVRSCLADQCWRGSDRA
jgi:dihydroorotate dehydrogenase electron transfer subunit